MENKQGIVVVGSLNADLVVTVERLPALGETLSGEDFHTFPGGKGANQAVAAAKLGGLVFHVGRVGRDGSGRMLLDSLTQAGVDTSYIGVSESEPTGTALITVDRQGDNTIIVVAGANGDCTPEFAEDALAQIEMGLLVLQLEIPMETVIRAAQVAKSKGARVVLNPAPAASLPTRLLQSVDLLVLNETEATVLTEVPVQNPLTAVRAGKALVEVGVPEVLITLGKQGVVYISSTVDDHVPAFSVTSVDTTAAGDAFIGGLAASLMRGSDVRTAIIFASAAGALAVTRLGAQSSLPTRAEVDEFLQGRR